MTISTPHLYPVRLTAQQRQELENVCRAGRASARMIRRARVLLLSDRNRAQGKLTRIQVAQLLGMHVNSVDRIRKRFYQEGPQATIVRQAPAKPPVAPKFDGHAEAHLVAICCGPAPEGRTRWTLRLLAAEMVKRRIVVGVSAETVRRTLKKMNCSLGGRNAGASPRKTRRGS